MTSISVQHDKHTATHFELQDDGTVYVSQDGDGYSVTAAEAFRELCAALAPEPTPVLVAEVSSPPIPTRSLCASCVDNAVDGPDGYCSTCRLDSAAHSPISG